MNITTKIELLDGRLIPQFGFGTWQLQGASAYDSVMYALEIGVRHIDTAAVYDNEEDVGRAIADAGIPREDVFVTSKVWNENQGYDSTISACHDSLERLDMDYVDLYLVHWPLSGTRIETYKALETLQRDSVVKSIGVSNFMVKHLEELLEETSVIPAVNQIELHPFNYEQRADVISLCEKNDIIIEAYSPLAQGSKFDDPCLTELAAKHNKHPAQILLRWSAQHEFVPLPRSASKKHIEDNYQLFDFELNEAEMRKLDGLNEELVTTTDPEQF